MSKTQKGRYHMIHIIFGSSLGKVQLCQVYVGQILGKEGRRVYTALCDSCFNTCCIFSTQIASQLSHVYSHTNFLFKFMNFLKIVHEEDCFVM